MKTVEQMKALLDALDVQLDSYVLWDTAALLEFENWLQNSKIWVEEGYIAHHLKNRGEE